MIRLGWRQALVHSQGKVRQMNGQFKELNFNWPGPKHTESAWWPGLASRQVVIIITNYMHN